MIVTIAIHAFSHKEVQQEELQETTSQQEKTSQESEQGWSMPDAVVETCMPAPLRKTPEIILQRKAYVVSYNKDTRCPNWVAWQLTAAHTDGELKRMNNFHEDEDCLRRSSRWCFA